MTSAQSELPAGIQTTDAPGVTTYYRSSSEPFTASLMFRVGRVDESLMNSGITHTVEHLAMSTVPMRRVEANAFVDPLRTGFYARGDQDRVLRMINAVAGGVGHGMVLCAICWTVVERKGGARGGGKWGGQLHLASEVANTDRD